MPPIVAPEGLPAAPAGGLLPPSVLEPVALRAIYPDAGADVQVIPAIAERTFSLYIHIPFCTQRCGYCDFNTYTAQELGSGASRKSYASTAAAEIEFAAATLKDSGAPARAVHSVFFGGGTPTLLPTGDLIFLLDTVRRTFGISPGAEITVEANPDTVTEEKIQRLAAAGFTRISYGMQSAVPKILRILERSHNPEHVPQAIQWAKRAGLFTSADLIYGTPTETMEEWLVSLKAAVSYGVDHISAYSLVAEPGTKLAAQIRRGEVAPLDEDEQARKYLAAADRLGNDGFEWYEISNWAREGRGARPAEEGADARSRHNLTYWKSGDWWGVGPGAHSHIGGVRWWNVKHPAAYARKLAEHACPAAGREVLAPKTRLDERIMLETRLREGLPVGLISEGGRRHISGYVGRGLVDVAGLAEGRLVLTAEGRLLADKIVRQLWE